MNIAQSQIQLQLTVWRIWHSIFKLEQWTIFVDVAYNMVSELYTNVFFICQGFECHQTVTVISDLTEDSFYQCFFFIFPLLVVIQISLYQFWWCYVKVFASSWSKNLVSCCHISWPRPNVPVGQHIENDSSSKP